MTLARAIILLLVACVPLALWAIIAHERWLQRNGWSDPNASG